MVEAVNASEMLIYVYKITRCNISEAFLDFVQLWEPEISLSDEAVVLKTLTVTFMSSVIVKE
jgi:hypothetical protein